jgi:acylphosphatase
MPQARRYTIRGRVQGVWFRESTRRQARALSLTGSAVNLANGDVEVHAYGEPAALDELYRWLQHGPPLAEVTEVTVETAEWHEVHDFATR